MYSHPVVFNGLKAIKVTPCDNSFCLPRKYPLVYNKKRDKFIASEDENKHVR